jgi:hypothetical protein
MEPLLALLLRSQIERTLKCTGALARPLQCARHRSVGPSLGPSCVVLAVNGTVPHSDSLRATTDFGVPYTVARFRSGRSRRRVREG